MNTDRLLTRVWDTQEKKMLYSEPLAFDDDYIYTTVATFAGHKLDYRLIGVNGEFINFVTKQNVWLPFCNTGRFIPMQCLGNTDKNKKLIYSADIVATSNNQYLVYWEEESAAFWFKRLDNECEILINDFGCEIEIIGNKFENENLLEVGE